MSLLLELKADVFLVDDCFSERKLSDTPLFGRFVASGVRLGWDWQKVKGALNLPDAPGSLFFTHLSEYPVSDVLSKISKAFWISRISESMLWDTCWGSNKQSEVSVVSLSSTETEVHCWVSLPSWTSADCWVRSISLWWQSDSITSSTIWTSSSSSSSSLTISTLSSSSVSPPSNCFSCVWAGDGAVTLAVTSTSVFSVLEHKCWTVSVTKTTEQMH